MFDMNSDITSEDNRSKDLPNDGPTPRAYHDGINEWIRKVVNRAGVNSKIAIQECVDPSHGDGPKPLISFDENIQSTNDMFDRVDASIALISRRSPMGSYSYQNNCILCSRRFQVWSIEQTKSCIL